MHRTLAAASAMALALTSGCGLAGRDQGAVEEVVIAANLEISGPNAAVGNVYANALKLKVDEVNRLGLLGRRKLTLLVRDNRSDASTSVANINSVAGNAQVAAIISGICAECILAATKTVNDRKVPTIALAVPSGVISPVSDRRYLFKLAPNVSDNAAVLASEMSRSGAKSVALVGTDDDYGQDAIDALTSQLKKLGLTVAATEKVSTTGDQLSTVVSAVTDAKPDAVAVLAFSPLAGQIGKSLRDGGFTKDLYFDSAAADTLFLTGGTAGAMEGAHMVFTPTLVSDDIIATSPAKAARKAWFRDYLSNYGTYAAFASFAADAVQLIVDAINQVGGTGRDQLRDAIESTQLDGLSGPIRITRDNHSGLMPQAVSMLVATSGRWRLAS